MSAPSAARAPAIRSRPTVSGPRAPAAPRKPRRISGPARHASGNSATQRRSLGQGGAEFGLIAGLRGLLEHRLLDRLLRGRISIALVAFALIGIVTLQLGLLKLNGGIGRALEREAALQRQNAALNIEDSELASADHVESRAQGIGMQYAPEGALRFLAASPRADIAIGAAALSGSAAGRSREDASAAGAGAQEGSAEAAASGSTAQAAAGEASATPAGDGEASATPSGSSSAGAQAPGGNGEQQSAPAGASPSTPAAASGPAPSSAAAPAGSAPAQSGAAGGTQASPQE